MLHQYLEHSDNIVVWHNPEEFDSPIKAIIFTGHMRDKIATACGIPFKDVIFAIKKACEYTVLDDTSIDQFIKIIREQQAIYNV